MFFQFKLLIFIVLISTCFSTFANFNHGQTRTEIAFTNDTVKPKNPLTVDYLTKNIRETTPRLFLTPKIEYNLKKKLQIDPLLKNYYAAIQLNAAKIQKEPLLTRDVVGLRLLTTSREMLYRMGILGMVYRIEKDEEVLIRINEELKAVCSFSDWNPSHFLDVAEMSLAVSLAVDWAGNDLPKATVELAKSSLIEKGIKPSFPENGEIYWSKGTNNWNQVCHAGMVAASIVVAEEDPDLAAKTISRALEGIPYALEKYTPDGVYPEGPMYWNYGTSFSAVTSSILESSFETDFGLSESPAFKESAIFRVLTESPSGMYYNFADSEDKPNKNGDIALAWFAARVRDSVYLEKKKFLQPPKSMGKLTRLAGPGFVWLSQFESDQRTKLPLAWKGEGSNPVVVFRGGEHDPGQFYFGGKGGSATVSHGHMDAGSFIFELDGVRWVVDPGTQSYSELEEKNFDLWGYCQDCDRWTLLTKNNFGHSTLTVNNALHIPKGFVPLIDYEDGKKPEATFDLTTLYGENLEKIHRRFLKESNRSLLIEDKITINASTKNITWQLLTTAEVKVTAGGATLEQEGKLLHLRNVSHPELTFSIISLDPAPLELDKQINGLKRIELRIPSWIIKEKKETIRVRLIGAK